MLQMLETSAIILAYMPSGIPNPSVLARFVKGYTQASLEKDEARGVMENVLFSMH